MIITDVTVRSEPGFCELSARAFPETGRTETRLWFRLPPHYREYLVARGDPFLPAALLPCMVRGERLRIEAPVSPRLLAASRSAQEIFCQWVRGVTRIEVEAVRAEIPAAAGAAVGSFFAGGVDSFYTLLKNSRLHQADGATITHLLLVRGIGGALEDGGVFAAAEAAAIRAAEAERKRLLLLATNLGDFGKNLVKHAFYHGTALASTALACGLLFRRVMIPASHTYRQMNAWGSHPLLDPLWSTETLCLAHDGCEASRAEKIIDWIGRSEHARANLRLCAWNGDACRNCGARRKCLDTALALHLSGCLDRHPILARALAADRLRRGLRIRREEEMERVNDLLRRLTDKGALTPFDRELRRAMLDALAQGRRALASKIGHGQYRV